MIVLMDGHAAHRPPQAEPDGPGSGAPDGSVPPPPPPPPRERMSRKRRILVWAAVTTAFVLVVGVVCGWLVYRQLNQNIRTADAGTAPSSMDGTQNILLIGSDNRSGSDAKYGTAEGARSDTAILFHTSADRQTATAVSIPRDSMVQIPACTKSDGSVAPATLGMFNSAFDEGGIACTVKTVQQLTGISVTHFVVLDFTGFAATVDALGGVKVCTTTALSDQDSGLDLPAGISTLNGEQALAFVRVRHIGNGSDLERIERQQYFLHEFSAQIRGSGLLADPLKLYRVLSEATKSIVTDPNLGSLNSLYSLAQTLNKIPNNNVTYETVPVAAYPQDPNRVVWQEPDSSELWASLGGAPVRSSSTAESGTDADAGGGESGTWSDSSDSSGVPAEPIAVVPAGSNAVSTSSDTTNSGNTSVPSGTDPQDMYTCPVN
jgi:LCP family protein required for cell wall assembly